MFLSFTKLLHKIDDSPILHCVSLCGTSYIKHHYLPYRLWTHVSDAIRMNDQVGELCLFTGSHPRVTLFSSKAQESES